MSKRPLTPEETRAWARVARSIRTLEPMDTDFSTALSESEEAGQRPSGRALARKARPSAEILSAQGVPSLGPSSAGLANRQRERRVRRGQIEISASFDLHGHTQKSAASALPRFLIRQRGQNALCVLVITGKGKQGEGILRRNFLEWLNTPPARALVSGYAEAHQRHGGAGAFYVFLRRAKVP